MVSGFGSFEKAADSQSGLEPVSTSDPGPVSASDSDSIQTSISTPSTTSSQPSDTNPDHELTKTQTIATVLGTVFGGICALEVIWRAPEIGLNAKSSSWVRLGRILKREPGNTFQRLNETLRTATSGHRCRNTFKGMESAEARTMREREELI
ncbi:hypothetical protein FRC20_007356 [Serendipita sp. 405]|nr:hypothetical protein FRC15_006948 [Serendipita sp. 397]KAG8866853.1 hypothetical protein FRC20_007356 [Serendipita sp. 405]